MNVARPRAVPLIARAGAVVLIAALGATCVHRPPVVANEVRGHGTDVAAHIRLGMSDGGIVRVPLEDYTVGSVLAELPLAREVRAAAGRMAMVQTILARTYALANLERHATEGFDLCATTHCQVFRPAADAPSPLRALVERAARDTRGLVVTYEGRLVQALFHADCGGATSSADSVWGGPAPPYLRGVDDAFCVMRPATPWRHTATASLVRQALNRDPRTRVGTRFVGVEVVDRDSAGRAVRVRLRGDRTTDVRAEVFRAVLTASFGPRAIKSTRFEVERDHETFVFSGTGHGHGVGACQVGVMARARTGHDPARILAHYYPGTRLNRLSALRRPVVIAN